LTVRSPTGSGAVSFIEVSRGPGPYAAPAPSPRPHLSRLAASTVVATERPAVERQPPPNALSAFDQSTHETTCRPWPSRRSDPSAALRRPAQRAARAVLRDDPEEVGAIYERLSRSWGSTGPVVAWASSSTWTEHQPAMSSRMESGVQGSRLCGSIHIPRPWQGSGA
jgi:hypothetical protein